jgi:hypothetical protein
MSQYVAPGIGAVAKGDGCSSILLRRRAYLSSQQKKFNIQGENFC